MLSPTHYQGTFCPTVSKKQDAVIPALLPLLDSSYGREMSPKRKGNPFPGGGNSSCSLAGKASAANAPPGSIRPKPSNNSCFGKFPTPLPLHQIQQKGGGPPAPPPPGASVPVASVLHATALPAGGGSPMRQRQQHSGGGAGREGATSPSGEHFPFQPRSVKPELSSSLQKKKPEEAKSPAPAGARKKRENLPTSFRRHYDRGDLPMCVKHAGTRNTVDWKVPPERLDFHHFLPIFFDGVREPIEPHRSLAVQGTYDMLKANPPKAVRCIPQLIQPVKLALDTRSMPAVCDMLKILQFFLLLSPDVGPAFVPYVRQLLPMFLLYVKWNRSTGDAIDFAQYKRDNVGELASETLQLIEAKCGPQALREIKRIIPTYG